jgi:hypothetical protein
VEKSLRFDPASTTQMLSCVRCSDNQVDIESYHDIFLAYQCDVLAATAIDAILDDSYEELLPLLSTLHGTPRIINIRCPSSWFISVKRSCNNTEILKKGGDEYYGALG